LRAHYDPFIRLPICPVQTPTIEITYLDPNNQRYTLDPSQYQISPGEPVTIRPAYGLTWPNHTPQPDCVQVTFVAGYSYGAYTGSITPIYGVTDIGVPDTLKLAVKQLVAHYYQNREPVGAQSDLVPLATESLMFSERWGQYP
jgi:hypothetical protein